MENKKSFVIGISGSATSGKDTLFTCLEEILFQYNIEIFRYSLADELKLQLNEFTKEQYGISAFTKDIKEKSLIRDLMVVHGKIKRKQTNGTYWTNILTPKIKESLNENIFPFVTDIRYDEYPEDEYFWLKNVLNGKLVYIERILADGSIVPPVNNDEKENNIRLKEKADFILKWPTTSDNKVRIDYIHIQLKSLLKSIIDVKYGN